MSNILYHLAQVNEDHRPAKRQSWWWIVAFALGMVVWFGVFHALRFI